LLVSVAAGCEQDRTERLEVIVVLPRLGMTVADVLGSYN
jgi:hypothetical protein